MTPDRRLPHGIFIGSHALADGCLTRRQLTGLYRRLVHNVYADPALPDDHRTRARGVALLLPPGAALGGHSAAAWYGAALSTAHDPVLVVAPQKCSWDGPSGVRVHRTNLRASEVTTTTDGVRVTRVERTAWDVATLESTVTAVCFLDAMLHQRQLTEAALMAEFVRRRGEWRCGRAIDLLPLVDGRAQSPPETRVRVACARAGLPRPVPQFVVEEDGTWLGQVDLAWPEAKLIVEYEGAYHFDGLQIVKDDGRYARFVAAGWRVLRLSSIDLRDMEGVVARIAAALAETAAMS